MTNTTKEVFDNLEQEINVFTENRTLDFSEAEPYLDEYHSKIIDYSRQVNDITGNIDFDNLNRYLVVPMNSKKRYDYIIERKYYLMGYRQMKIFKARLIKMNASYQTGLESEQVQASSIIS